MFPRKPFLDRVIIEVTPIEQLFQQGKVSIPLDNAHVRVRSDRGIVKSVGDCVAMGQTIMPMPVSVGDEVFFDEMAYAGRIFLDPHDQYRSDMPVYLEVRVGDLLGVIVPQSVDEQAVERLEEVINA
jgi:co-chaperonin GroES (HSP10)